MEIDFPSFMCAVAAGVWTVFVILDIINSYIRAVIDDYMNEKNVALLDLYAAAATLRKKDSATSTTEPATTTTTTA